MRKNPETGRIWAEKATKLDKLKKRKILGAASMPMNEYMILLCCRKGKRKPEGDKKRKVVLNND
jgi:hypothetical protein